MTKNTTNNNNVSNQRSIREGQSVLTAKNFRAIQSENAALIREVDNANHSAKQAIVEKNEIEKKLSKSKKRTLGSSIVAGVLSIALLASLAGNMKQCKINNDTNKKYADWISPDEYKNMKTKLAEAEKTIANLNTENAQTKADLEAARTELESIKTNLTAQELVNQGLLKENEALKAENKELKDELEAANAKIAELLEEIDEKLARIAELEALLDHGNQNTVSPNQPSTDNNNVSVGDVEKEDVNENDSNLEDNQGGFQPIE